jgi:hypothetical protein
MKLLMSLKLLFSSLNVVETNNMVNFIIGAVVGGMVGGTVTLVVMCCLIVGGRYDRD